MQSLLLSFRLDVPPQSPLRTKTRAIAAMHKPVALHEALPRKMSFMLRLGDFPLIPLVKSEL